MNRPIFSSSWHQVADLRPRLLPHARLMRHRYRGELWYVLHDQTSGKYHRMSPTAHALVSKLDGERTLQSVWDEICAGDPEEIVTQNEIVELLMQLHAADVLSTNVTPDSAALLKRQRDHRRGRLKQYFGNPLSLRFPLISPDAFLTRWAPHVAWIFSRRGFALWLAVVLPALFLAAEHWAELTENVADRVLSAQNLVLIGCLFVPVKLLHELGHGFATRVWGGAVPEMGVMFLVFAPVPYVDSSAAATFSSKYRRAIVGAAGMMVELVLASGALYLWLIVEPGLVRAIAFNVMLIAGVSTVVVNGNPLLRYDGYFILSDLIEIPNLAQRASKYLTFLCDRYVFQAKDVEAPPAAPGERKWLVPFGLLSWSYRTAVTIGIILFVATKFFAFGVLLALWGTWSLLAQPIWKAVRHVLSGPTLRRQRRFAIRLTSTCVCLLIVGICLVPAPSHSTAEGIVWLPEQFLIRAQADGFFDRWLIASGHHVDKGTPLLVMMDPEVKAKVEATQAEFDELTARYQAVEFTDSAAASIVREQMRQVEQKLAFAQSKYARLFISAAADGELIIPNAQDMPGHFFKKGELLGYVLNRTQLVARVAVAQENIDLVRNHLRAVEVRAVERRGEASDSMVLRAYGGAVTELPSAALTSFGGGELPADPSEEGGLKTLHSVFLLDLTVPSSTGANGIGAHVYARFEHVREPIAMQLYRRIRQLLLSRLNV